MLNIQPTLSQIAVSNIIGKHHKSFEQIVYMRAIEVAGGFKKENELSASI